MGGWVVGGGWAEEIEDKVHLSPAEAEIWAELGNSYLLKQNLAWLLDPPSISLT